MTLNMLVFEYREVEKEFFKKNKFENFNISFYEESLTPDNVNDIPEEIRDNTHVISVFINSNIDVKVIKSFRNLRIISTRSTGYDHINISECKNKNIAVVNVADYGAKAVAQYTFGLIIALVRKIFIAAMYIKNLQSNSIDFNGRDLSKLTLGVVGTGAIGAAVCRIAKNFGMSLLAYDIAQKRELEDELGLQYTDFDELVKNSDIITVHAPYNGHNYHMFSDCKFKMMKDGAYFINTSRGELVDLKALYNYVNNGKLQGVALDVLVCESISFACDRLAEKLDIPTLECAGEVKYSRKLAKFNNVIITPHIAYDTLDSVNFILETTMRSITNVIYGEKSSRIV